MRAEIRVVVLTPERGDAWQYLDAIEKFAAENAIDEVEGEVRMLSVEKRIS